jgi:hypothetical protein
MMSGRDPNPAGTGAVTGEYGRGYDEGRAKGYEEG